MLEPGVVAAAAALAAALAASAVAAHRLRSATGDAAAAVRVASFGAPFFLIALAPTSLVPNLDPLAEHRVYLASLGVFLGVVGGSVAAVRALARRGWRRAPVAAAAAWLAVSAAAGVATARRSAVWSTAPFLVEFPSDADALAALADVELFAGRHAEAERAALAALQSAPGSATALKVLGFARVRRGDLDGAREALRAAAATNPIDPYLFWELGESERKAGEVASACAAYGRSAALPGNPWISAAARRAREPLGCR